MIWLSRHYTQLAPGVDESSCGRGCLFLLARLQNVVTGLPQEPESLEMTPERLAAI